MIDWLEKTTYGIIQRLEERNVIMLKDVRTWQDVKDTIVLFFLFGIAIVCATFVYIKHFFMDIPYFLEMARLTITGWRLDFLLWYTKQLTKYYERKNRKR